MHFRKWLDDLFNASPPAFVVHNRRYKLIYTITIEVALLGLVIVFFTLKWQQWYLSLAIITGLLILTLNMLFLRRTGNTTLAGHIIVLSCFTIITLGIIWVGSISSSYFGWYNVIPILAAACLGWVPLLFYSALTIIATLFFTLVSIEPMYTLTSENELLVNIINRFFTLLLIITTLYGLLKENHLYIKLLNDYNKLLKADKDKFHYLARYDALTNLPNRSYFYTYLEATIETAKTKMLCATVFFMDLDRLKEVNDIYGHDAGDNLLLQSAKRLQGCFREYDFLARLGGDEFTAVITHLREDSIPEVIAARIINEFNQPFTIAGQELLCKVSIGLASYPQNGANAEELITKADAAMYDAKKTGGNAFKIARKNKSLL